MHREEVLRGGRHPNGGGACPAAQSCRTASETSSDDAKRALIITTNPVSCLVSSLSESRSQVRTLHLLEGANILL